MRIDYRKAVEIDEASIRTLLEQAQLPTESLGTNITEFFVAEADGVVGVAGFEFYGNDALLRSVAIQSSQQNKGIGSAMVDWMVSRAKARETRRIILLTDTAKRFFEKKGFVVVDRSLMANDAMKKSSEFASVCPASSITMMLDLT